MVSRNVIKLYNVRCYFQALKDELKDIHALSVDTLVPKSSGSWDWFISCMEEYINWSILIWYSLYLWNFSFIWLIWSLFQNVWWKKVYRIWIFTDNNKISNTKFQTFILSQQTFSPFFFWSSNVFGRRSIYYQFMPPPCQWSYLEYPH